MKLSLLHNIKMVKEVEKKSAAKAKGEPVR